MCGIAGFVGQGTRSDLERMVNSLRHRGPDDCGHWVLNNVALGMRRLAIIDVEMGQQPLFSPDGTKVVVFNGEIYNAPELRAELESEGFQFKTDHSDTEVILPLYQKHGVDFPNKLRGMFSIAIWDCVSEELILVRDRAGIKPLYYAATAHGLVFGSEVKALLTHPLVSCDPDFVALHHYLSLKNIPSPLSAFEHIRQLSPGHCLTYRESKIQIDRWWKLDFSMRFEGTEQEAISEVRRMLEESVALHMRSDVPFGAYLSGGVDSSSVVALMARQMEQPVKTFTLAYDDGFEHKDQDQAYALEVSRRYGTDHHEFTVRFEDVPSRIDEVVRAFDEPFSGVISTFFLTELIGEHVKVCLSGDGADELFASYLSHRIAKPLALRSQSNRFDIEPSDRPSSDYGEWVGRETELDRILERGDYADQRMALYICDDEGNRSLYSKKMKALIGETSTAGLVREIDSQFRGDDETNRALHLDFETLLPDQVLAFVDRLSMAHSVEVRPPFLDHPLIELAASIPGAQKIKRGRVKHVLKEAVRGLIPGEILDRPKEGFLMPINHWVLNNLEPYVTEVLSEPRLSRHGLFDTQTINQLLAAHYSGKANYGNRIWNILNLQLWWEAYIDRPA
jgi:asparagine synthase (glutamine-hydrolysing)